VRHGTAEEERSREERGDTHGKLDVASRSNDLKLPEWDEAKGGGAESWIYLDIPPVVIRMHAHMKHNHQFNHFNNSTTSNPHIPSHQKQRVFHLKSSIAYRRSN
jgi:hypothetical protein